MLDLRTGVFLLCFSPGVLVSIDLKFQYLEGDKFQFKGQSEQSVWANGTRIQTNNNDFQTAYAVIGVDRGEAHLTTQTLFRTVRKGIHTASQAAESLQSEFSVDELGHFTVCDATRPVMRSIPTFPGHALVEKQTWSAPATEVVELSRMGIFSQNRRPLPPVNLAFPVNYTYQGTVSRDGKVLEVIDLEFTVSYRTAYSKDQFRIYPVLITETTHQQLYFNNALGVEDSHAEANTLILVLSNGDLYEFQGTSRTELASLVLSDRPVPAENAAMTRPQEPLSFEESGKNSRTEAEGTKMISLGRVSFLANSFRLLPDEALKLRAIAQVLREHPGDILVEGFTTDAGTQGQQKRLSEERAVSVGEFLLEIGARLPDQILYRGMGSRRPCVPNDSEENRERNRRVEITLLQD